MRAQLFRHFAVRQVCADGGGVGNGGGEDAAKLGDDFAVDAGAVGQNQDAAAELLGFRKDESGMGKVGAIGLHAMAAREEIAAGQDVFGREHGEQFVAREAGSGFVDFEDNVLEIGALVFVVGHQGDAGDGGDFAAVGAMVAAIRLHEFAEAFERSEAHGGAGFGHFAVGADVNDVVVAVEAEVAHEAHFSGEGVVVGEDSAAFEGVEELGGVKTEDFAAAKAADEFAAIGAGEGVSGSNRSCRLRRRAMACKASMSQARPQVWTPMMAVVRGVIIVSTCAGSRLWVRGSISQNTGVISCH